ncbi:MAG: TldD/PmbA family protein [Candidatus Coatesbacteria bacterium]|nr:MAG: TldD/PmbA family protein [Candidatus Coatesbacteria bacterium]
MIGKERAFEILEKVVGMSDGDETDVMLTSRQRALTRFANSIIHQNVSTLTSDISIRVVKGKRVGVASTDRIHDDESLRNLVKTASTIAEFQQENPNYMGLPGPAPYQEVDAFCEATAAYSPSQRAEAVKTIVDICTKASIIASGSFKTESGEIAIANSKGVAAYFPSTGAEVTTVVMKDGQSGYASASANHVAEIDVRRMAEEAADTCLRNVNQVEIEPGKYDVVLHPYAVGNLISILCALEFGALAKQEGRSFMSEKMGQKMFSDSLTVWDDGLDPSGMPLPFDFEGVPKQKVVLIENGVAKNVVYDTATARREGRESTGHALPPGNTFGPVPINVFMKPGTESLDGLVSKVSRGLYVTRFHYINPFIDLKNAVFTGMTRDGTFLIEDGKMTRAVKNLRFTMSMIDAFNSLDGLTKETVFTGDWAGVRVPGVLIRGFNFSGKTQF